ncbi:MAG TPA: molybdopterin-guanine dinucleotide biosynthesis protein B [Syntrophorhabdaceae bacterium]|nr:molybdopterin-guanine dinucleotide biosynthesis protein B [Syntrophorhabdaceae bacterium]
MNTPPLIGIAGTSKVGKTTLIERLIPVFIEKGLNVAVIKHHPHDFDIDIPGKDTHRLKTAGAKTTIISSPKKIAMVSDVKKELMPKDIASRFITDVDLIIVEGYKRERIPKIEVFRHKKDAKPVCANDEFLIAYVSDSYFSSDKPVFLLDEIDKIADFIIDYLRKNGP